MQVNATALDMKYFKRRQGNQIHIIVDQCQTQNWLKMERTEYCQTKKLEISYNNWKILTGKFVSVNRLEQRYVKTVWATAVFDKQLDLMVYGSQQRNMTKSSRDELAERNISI